MEQVAKADGFRHIFYGDPHDRRTLLGAFELWRGGRHGGRPGYWQAAGRGGQGGGVGQAGCGRESGRATGPDAGQAANAGRDKITIFTSPEIYDLGAWLEQLIAESTGKLGKGITPVDREAIGAPEVYGKDRIFAYIR